MPWISPDAPFGRLGVAQVDADAFRLLHPLTYVDRDGVASTVPEGTVTDLASVPFVFWGQIGSAGRQARSAVVHDHGTAEVRAGFPRRGRAALRARSEVDLRFLHGLLDDGVPRARALLMWAAVSVHRVLVHGPVWLAVAVVAQLVLGTGLLLRAVVVDDLLRPWSVVLPLAFCLLWGRTAGAMALLQGVGVLAVPLALANLLVSAVLWLVNLVLTGGRERGTITPTAVATRALGLRL